MQNTFDLIVIIVSVLFGIALLCIVLYRLDISKKKIKYSLIAITFLCGYGVVLYAYKQSIIQAKITEFQDAFYNNDTLICMQNGKEIHINKTTFIYFKDLLSFSGKDSMKGINVPIIECKQHISTKDDDFIND